MRPPEDRCALSDIPAELRRLYGQTASYSVLWKAAVEGAFPAERVRNRWFVRRCRPAARGAGARHPDRERGVRPLPRDGRQGRPPPRRADGARLLARG